MTTTIETTSTTGLIGIEAAMNACKGDVVITNGYDRDKGDYLAAILENTEDGEEDTTEYILQDGEIDGQPCEHVIALNDAGYQESIPRCSVMDTDDYAKTGREA